MAAEEYRKLSDGERMVWAAAYAATLTRAYERGPASRRRREGDVVTAVETAWAAVKDLREATDAVKEAFGAGDEVARMLSEVKHGF